MAADSGEFREFPVPEEPEIDLLGHRESEDPDLWRPVRGAASDFLVFIIEKMRWPIVVALSITVVAIILILFSIPILLLLNVFNWPWGAIISPDQQQNAERIATSIRDSIFGALVAGVIGLIATLVKRR